MSLALLSAVLATAALAALSPGSSTAAPAAHQAATAKSAAPTKSALLHPAKKYFGISVAGAPYSLGAVNSVTSEVGKQPNMLMFFQAWNSNAAAGTSNIDTTGIVKACQAGLLPMLTWESWSTSARISSNPGVAYTQPAFNMKNIINGQYDKYIKAVATAIKGLGCPIALRFDQEQNGYWYPWGLWNTNENGTNRITNATEYKNMWVHVWNIFSKAGASNVIWTWSPNNQPVPTKANQDAPLQASYPGAKYVDLIAIDSYYNKLNVTFGDIFNTTDDQIRPFAAKVPWIVGETAVGTDTDKPAEITDLLTQVLRRPHFIGFVYFDQHKSTDRSNWLLNETSQSQAAFKAGIANSRYAAGKAGTL
jgi:mannan endo-1,4-beta-mannosidase